MNETARGTGAGETAREHLAVFAESAASCGALVYFGGFVYLYYYYVDFGVSLLALQPSPQYVLTFSYNLITHNGWATFGTVIGALVFVRVYEAIGAWLKRPPGHQDAAQCGLGKWWQDRAAVKGLQDILAQPGGRWLVRTILPVLVAAFIYVAFQALFWWAQHVARDDAKLLYQRAHEGSPQHMRVFEARRRRAAHETPELTDIVKAVNAAGCDGRALPIGESADRIFILVGTTPRGADDPLRRLSGDKVFSIEKSEIALELSYDTTDSCPRGVARARGAGVSG